MHQQKSTQARTNLGLILGDRSSTRLYTVNLDKPNPTNSMELFEGACVRALAYSKSEDKVLLELDNTFFVWCDWRMRKSELVKIHGAPEVVATEFFVGSLVTL
ncbi:hypothetical protein D5086_014174 [Populus alba]|uniref:Uncharacterized protein n=1 Tax=Populus alba TaxID=43335 RepID=A0ACC4C8E3_POPAL